ncbi:unnamed protein product [Caenorhabditis auriculariae]|uniref:lysozyme n=1 Tax=Caenorhabditis auriculariae TaxID=2777116 RepID=A0A8S1HIV4_9PELO|nr:unnamed protein product [Caenorhabditis auriculariae]
MLAKLLLVAVLVSAVAADTCLHCICLHESGCKPLGCRMDVGSLSCGYYQLKLPYYEDCGQVGKKAGETTEAAWKRCSDDYNCSTECVQNYYNRYKGNCASTGEGACQVMARNHNGGPNGCKYAGTAGYWNAIHSFVAQAPPIMRIGTMLLQVVFLVLLMVLAASATTCSDNPPPKRRPSDRAVTKGRKKPSIRPRQIEPNEKEQIIKKGLKSDWGDEAPGEQKEKKVKSLRNSTESTDIKKSSFSGVKTAKVPTVATRSQTTKSSLGATLMRRGRVAYCATARSVMTVFRRFASSQLIGQTA